MSGTGSSLTAPGSINDARTRAHLAIGQRLGTIDLTPLLIYTVTSAPASALPFLAWQFDVSSPFYSLLASGAAQQTLIENAIQLHRYNGTLYAITTIMATLGFQDVTVEEGQASWGGATWPANEGWAVFRVYANDVTMPVSAMTEALAVAAINFFKPERSWLDSLWFAAAPLADAVTVSDFIVIVAEGQIAEAPLEVTDYVSVTGWTLADTKTIAPLYSAHFYHAGILYGPPQPAVADSGLVINEVPTE